MMLLLLLLACELLLLLLLACVLLLLLLKAAKCIHVAAGEVFVVLVVNCHPYMRAHITTCQVREQASRTIKSCT